jgi:hypothetical protein
LYSNDYFQYEFEKHFSNLNIINDKCCILANFNVTLHKLQPIELENIDIGNFKDIIKQLDYFNDKLSIIQNEPAILRHSTTFQTIVLTIVIVLIIFIVLFLYCYCKTNSTFVNLSQLKRSGRPELTPEQILNSI